MVKDNIVPAIILILISTTTFFIALHLLSQVLTDKKFRFVRNQLLLIITFECSVFIHGIFWIDSYLAYNGFGKFLNVTYLLVAKISLLMLFWNLAFMYYLTSKQLFIWVETMKSIDEPEILFSKFSLKM